MDEEVETTMAGSLAAPTLPSTWGLLLSARIVHPERHQAYEKWLNAAA